MSEPNQIDLLLEHLGICHAYLATQCPEDIEVFCKNHTEKVAGIALIGPNDVNGTAFKDYHNKIMFLKSDSGSTHTTAEDFRREVKTPHIYELKQYEILPWSDIAIDRPVELVASITSFFEILSIKQTQVKISQKQGRVGNVNYSIHGSGPPLILLPFTLSAAQWGPVLQALSERFTVVVASGPSLGFVPTLERRAFLPTYQTMFSSLISMMNIPKNGRVLELGCGTGALCRQALKLRPDLAITGADINDHLLNGGSQIAENEGIRVDKYFENKPLQESEVLKPGELTLIFSDATNIPFPDNFFDSVYSVTVLEECDSIKALAEIHRVLKPDGVAGIVVRAIDMPQWLSLDVSEELNRKISIPPQLVSSKGVADKSLYTKMALAKFGDLISYPFMFSACGGEEGTIYEWYFRRTRQVLSKTEQMEFDAAVNNVTDKTQLIFSTPLHCCIGWKRPL